MVSNLFIHAFLNDSIVKLYCHLKMHEWFYLHFFICKITAVYYLCFKCKDNLLQLQVIIEPGQEKLTFYYKLKTQVRVRSELSSVFCVNDEIFKGKGGEEGGKQITEWSLPPPKVKH